MVVVYPGFSKDLLYIRPTEMKVTILTCPIDQKGSYIWYKNFILIPNQGLKKMRIHNSSKADQGIYTCVCTWEHHGQKHNTSGDFEVVIKDQTKRVPPTFSLPVNNSEVITDVGAELILTCSVFFGSEVCKLCSANWVRIGPGVKEINKSEEKIRLIDGSYEVVLNISKVSEQDLQSEFRCVTRDEHEIKFALVILKRQASLLPVNVVCTSICFVLLLFGGLLKWLALDIKLFFRKTFSQLNRKEDGKQYDAYVIHENNNCEEDAMKAVSDFINGPLLMVLELHCGFKLFIHGRDDLPGEDRMNLIEERIKLSRRLLIILTPESSSGEAYDLQVGLHQALVQGETGVIVIQLGSIQDRTRLPLGLQHLLSRTPPLLWRNGKSTPSSRFWKQVRYQMPAAPRRNRLLCTVPLHPLPV